MAKARYTEPAEVPEVPDYDFIRPLEQSDGSGGPYYDISLSLRGRPVSWNETKGELTIGVPVVYDERIREGMDDLVTLAMPNAESDEQDRIIDKLLDALYREQVKAALLALVKN